MMNYRQNRIGKWAKIFLPIFFILLIAIFVYTPLMRISFDALEGVFVGARDNLEDSKGILASIFFANRSLTELQDLRAENEALKLELQIAPDREVELAELAEIKRNLSTENSAIITRIIMRPPASGFDTLILEMGENMDVRVGDLIASGSVALGRITEILDRTIRVRLFTHYEEETLGFLAPQELEQKILGNSGGNFKIELPREIEVSEGDRIYLSQNQDYLLGTVEKVVFDSRDPFKTVLVGLPINIQNLRFVEIVK